MLKKRLIFLAILLIALVSISVASAAEDVSSSIANTNDDVSLEEISDEGADIEDSNDNLLSTANEDEKLSDTPKSFKDLNDAINGQSNVSLDSDYVFSDEDYAFEHGIKITHDMTINGNGYTIDGNNMARIFTINLATVVFENITFVNGKTPGEYGHGGAIWVNDNSKATAINCTFENNEATYLGGATHGDLTAIDCTFIGNVVKGKHTQNGGAMNEGTAINCNFISNEAGWYGGAICDVTATNCTFISNSAIYGYDAYSSSCENCIFVDSAKISASNFLTTYNSGAKFTFDLIGTSEDGEINIDNESIAIKITQGDEEKGTYNALSGKDNGWIVDLEPGIYNATLSFATLEPVTVKLTINKIATEVITSAIATTYNINKDFV